MGVLELVPASLVDVALGLVATPIRMWRSPCAGSQLLHAYCLPILGDLHCFDEKVSGRLEMYGGAGLGANAGGVRCANVGAYQIKGIGSSVLAGPGTDKWHRHGALSLQDAVRESIMSELFHIASPHGAVRALGIADLGVAFTTEIGEDKLPGSAPRALLYREQSIRVAHFMRSSYMDVGPELAGRELLRMREGVPVLVDWLCRGRGVPGFQVAAQGLSLVFELLMQQLAVLRTKRLVHGSLIPSNFCLDGRLLDFTTSTAVSTLQPVMVSLGGLTSQQQHHQVLEALPDVLFYLSKFDPRCAQPRAALSAMVDFLTAQLNASHHEYLMAEHLSLIGFSTSEIGLLSRSTKASLIAALMKAIASGSVRGHFYFGGDEHPMLPQAGRDDLFALVARTVESACDLRLPLTRHYQPGAHDFPAHVVRDIRDAFGTALGELGQGALSIVERGFAWLVRAMQRHADLTPLYRRNLDGVINEICTSGGEFGALIEATIADWQGVFSTPADGHLNLQGWLCADSVQLLPDGRIRHADALLGPLALGSLQPSPRIRPRHNWLFELAASNALQ